MEWYREYEHLGYDVLGKKIIKPASGDQIDEFLDKMENPNYWFDLCSSYLNNSYPVYNNIVVLFVNLRAYYLNLLFSVISPIIVRCISN